MERKITGVALVVLALLTWTASILYALAVIDSPIPVLILIGGGTVAAALATLAAVRYRR